MPHIGRFLDISITHLSESDKDYLRMSADPDSPFGVAAYSLTYGWFMYATDDPDVCEMPPHIRVITAYARYHGCDYVLFDADALVDDALPVYDEEPVEEAE